jgi:Ca2+-binding RTX toxin-like protein
MTISNDATTPIDTTESVDAASGSSVIDNTVWPADPLPITLTEGDDTASFILPFGVNTTIYALGGNDRVDVTHGAATIYGGAGDDYISAEDVPGVFMDGGDGNDRLDYTSGNATLIGGNGNDLLICNNQIDSTNLLDGGAGDDFFSINGVGTAIADGGDGNDTFFLALNGNTSLLSGGAGDDLFLMRTGVAWVDGGDGLDTVNYLNTGAVSIDLLNQQNNGGGAAGQVLVNIENFALSPYDDVFVGTSAAETVLGGAGNDHLYGGGGNDDLDGGEGYNYLDGGPGADVLLGHSFSYDVASYEDATTGVSIDLTKDPSTWTGDAQGDVFISIEQFNLSSFADIFHGDDNVYDVNFVDAGDGDDQIFAGGGDDYVWGDAGNDLLDGGAGADFLAGGDGWDITSYQDATAGVGIDLTKDSSTWTGDAHGDLVFSIEQFDLSNFADTFHGDATDNFVYGGAGNDSLDGGASNDWLDGGAGADTLIGGDGLDTATISMPLPASASI